MANLNFKIDTEKCIHCGLCEKDCIANIIKLNEDKIPQIAPEKEKRCIKCQHCLAICPTGALSILDKDPQESNLCNNFPDSEQLLNLIQSRRSDRHFKSENLPQQTLEQLKGMLKYTPTGCNNHKLHISIIEDREVMDKFRNRTNNTIKKVLLSMNNNPLSKKFSNYKNAFLNGDDVIFRGAPHMIVVSTPINAPCADIDPTIALSYFELYAQSLGVGTLWCGFAHICLKLIPELCEFLEIPEGYKPGYVMLFGPKDIKYTRTTQPEDFQISVVKGDKAVDKLQLDQKLKRYFWNIIR